MKKFIPHLTIVLSAMTLTFFIMAFMTSELSKAVFAALAVCAAITSIYLIGDNFREDDRRERRRLKKLKQNAGSEKPSDEDR